MRTAPRAPLRPRPASGGAGFELAVLGIAGLVLVPGLLLDLAGGIGALLLHGRFAAAPGRVVPDLALAVARHPGDPSLAWPATTRDLVPGPFLLYLIAVALTASVAALFFAAVRRVAPRRRRAGFASRTEMRKSLSVAAVRARARQVRPSVAPRRAKPAELGLFLGREVSTGKPLWASLEDSFLVLGPPRSGKSAGLIIPGVLEAPGAIVSTSTRPDVLRATAAARRGPVEVFDPQSLSGWPTCLAWSPVAGCEEPRTAILRAKGFAAGAGFDGSTTNSGFWLASATAVIRAYLHAAALEGRSIVDVISWSARPTDNEPIRILRRAPGAAPTWAEILAGQAGGDPEERDEIWSGVQRAFDCFADPQVLAACSPSPGEAFDARALLARRGAVYIVGSADDQLTVAPLITALVADLTDAALRLAARAPHGRLDPPLTLFLDEAANIAPLASLPTLLSSGGGSGICTVVVLQSLAQARARWGQDRADAIWDASTVRLVFGGLGHAEDLTRISRLAGEIDEEVESASRGASGASWSTSLRSRPVLPPERIRSLEEGRVLVLHRRTPPVEALLDPWYRRACAPLVERALREADRLCGPAPEEAPIAGPEPEPDPENDPGVGDQTAVVT